MFHIPSKLGAPISDFSVKYAYTMRALLKISASAHEAGVMGKCLLVILRTGGLEQRKKERRLPNFGLF